MAETKWDGKRNAPQSLFRVLGEDTYPFPPEEYWVGDFAEYEAAKQAARKQVGEMNSGSVYDDQGRLKFLAIKKEQAEAVGKGK